MYRVPLCLSDRCDDDGKLLRIHCPEAEIARVKIPVGIDGVIVYPLRYLPARIGPSVARA